MTQAQHPPTDSSCAADFDFLIGNWRVQHRRLQTRLVGCTSWDTFEGCTSVRKVLGGQGNTDDNWLDLPGGAYRALTLRSFDAGSGLWSIWWLDSRHPGQLDVPVVGRFEAGLGSFFAEDSLNGQDIRVRFLWTQRSDLGQPRWEQAFSIDGGASWENNWVMDFSPALADQTGLPCA